MDDDDMIGSLTLSPDAEAIVLLCTSLGTDRDGAGERPLGPKAFGGLATAVERSGLSGPGELVGLDVAEIAKRLRVSLEDAEAHARRLGRFGQLGFELDRLGSRGIWVLTVVDDAYPRCLSDRLGSGRPPVLFGSGPVELLDGGGVAIVGSRDVDDPASSFAEHLAAAVARGGDAVVSGGARGVDAIAMRGAFDAGGTVVGVLPEGVERRLKEASTRSAVADGRAVIASPYHPSAPFSAGAAMGRNRLVYALSDVAVVVNSADGTGGTWTGAIEALDAGWVPVLVRDGADVPAGNRALLDRGAAPLPGGDVPSSISASDLVGIYASGAVRQTTEPAATYQPGLFDD